MPAAHTKHLMDEYYSLLQERDLPLVPFCPLIQEAINARARLDTQQLGFDWHESVIDSSLDDMLEDIHGYSNILLSFLYISSAVSKDTKYKWLVAGMLQRQICHDGGGI